MMMQNAGRPASPRVFKPDFRENSVVEERDRSGRVIGRFRCGKLLGRGGFGKCYEFTDLDAPPNAPVLACKVIDRASLQKAKNLQKLHSEIAIHKRMKHKNIVNFIRTFQDEWFVYMLLEKCSNQTLMEVSKTRSRFSIPETQFIMLQTIAALQYMHDQYVIHRDLKLGNMMLDDNMNVKIGDFGLAAELQYDGERKRTICGTPNYIAPEILEGARDGHSYEVDVWSLGVILFTLLVGEPPFQTADVKTTYDRIKRCQFTFPAKVDSPAGKDLVHRILQAHPHRRPTLVEIRNHQFFKAPTPPTVAPITMYPQHKQRQLAAEGYGGAECDVPRDPLRPLWSANQAPTTGGAPALTRPSPREQAAPGSARGVAPAFGAPFPTAASAEPTSVRTRTNSVPVLTSTRRPDSATIPTVGGWCAPPVSAVPAPASTVTSARQSEEVVAPKSPRDQAKRGRQATTEDEEEKNHLTEMHEKLHKTVLGTLEDEPRGSQEALTAPKVWITDYADFSAKYGLAYKLSTGHTGVHFNDSTKMVWEPITGRTEYYNRIKENVNGVVVAQDKRESFVMDAYPESLQKKVTLIKYFKSYLSRGRSGAGAKGSGSTNVEVHSGPYVNSAPALLSEPHMVSDMIYVKRWIQNPEAMILRLSNKVVQVAFNDGAEVLLSSESRVVTYTDPQGHRRTMFLSAVARESEEIAQRLRYTRDTLSKLISNREL